MISILILLQLFLPPDNTAKSVRMLTVDDGLSQSLVYAIAQDSLGFMWLGTKEGLNRYDGYAFKIYRSAASKPGALRGNYVTKIHTDQQGRLLVHTLPGGLHLYRYEWDDFVQLSALHPSADVLNDKYLMEIEDHSEGWWVRTSYERGLFFVHAHSGKVQRVMHSNGTPLEAVVLAARPHDLLVLDEKERWWRITWQDDSLAVHNYQREHETQLPTQVQFITWTDKAIWYIHNYQLYRKKHHQADVERIAMGTHPDAGKTQVRALEYSNGTVQAVTLNHLLVFNEDEPSHKEFYSLKSALSYYRDRSGLYWVGTSGYGVHLINPQANRFGFTQSTFHQVTLPRFNAVMQKQFGQQFATPTPVFQKTSIIHDRFDDQLFWIAFKYQGLYSWHEAKSEVKRHIPPSEQVFPLDSMYQDEDGVLWLGAKNGITEYHPSTGKSVYHTILDEQQAQERDFFIMVAERLTAVYKDKKGFLWVANPFLGLIKYHLETQRKVVYQANEEDPQALSTNFILHITNDPIEPERYLWLATDGGGLHRFDTIEETFLRFNAANGLPNNVIYSVLAGSDNQLWCSTNLGIIRINPTTFEVHHFDRFDGLQSNEFNRQQFMRTNSGEIVMSGPYGSNRFNPLEILPNVHPPKVQITSLSIFGKEISIGNNEFPYLDRALPYQKRLHIPWHINVLHFTFASLDFTAPQKNQYQYKLDGFDEHWRNAGRVREATYTNLNPGEYTLLVRGANNDGIWSQHYAMLHLTVTPPWWKTNWFLSVSFLVLMGAVSASVWAISTRNQRKKLREMEFNMKLNQEKVRISRDMHDAIGARLTQIKLMSSVPTGVNSEEIAEVADEVIAQCSEMVWSLNPENDHVDQMVEYMVQFASRFCEAVGQTLRLSLEDEYPALPIHSETRHEVLMVVKEALHNAVKYAQAAEMVLHIHCNARTLHISIMDNGRGFDEAGLRRTGNGLKNMRERMANIGGTCSIKSSVGQGTQVEISLNM